MSWGGVLAVMFAAKVSLLLTALPVAFVFLIINIFGSYLIFGGYPGLEQMVRNEQVSVAQFSLVPIPLFVHRVSGELHPRTQELIEQYMPSAEMQARSKTERDAFVQRVFGAFARETVKATPDA